MLDSDVIGQAGALGEEGIAEFAPVGLDLEMKDVNVLAQISIVGEPAIATGAQVLLVQLVHAANVGVEPALAKEPLVRTLRALDVLLLPANSKQNSIVAKYIHHQT